MAILVERVVKVRVVFIEEFADHHHLAIFKFNNRLQRHAFVVTLANVTNQPFSVVVVVNLFNT